MAIKTRTLADGSKAYRVTWVIGGGATGTGVTGSETFSSPDRAQSFHDDVRSCGWRWPDGWVKGEGYVKPAEAKSAAFTFAEVAADHFALQSKRVAKGLKKPYTQHRDMQAYRIHLAPSFDHKPFAHVQLADIERWIDLQLQYGASPKSIRNRHGLLYMIMGHGQKRMALRMDNPCELTELPAEGTKRDLMFLHPWEWKILRGCLRDDAQLIADVLLMTAARWGEISAATLADCQIVSADRLHIQLRQAWSKRAPDDPAPIRKELGENRSWKLGAPKNKRARFVTVTGDVAVALIATMTGKTPDDYLFTTRTGKPWRYPDFEYDRWRQAVHLAMQAGLTRKITIHMLRHTAAVWALASGMKIEEVSEMLGHASIQVTWDVYGGLVNLRDPKMAKKLAKAMKTAQQAIVPGATIPTRKAVNAAPVRPNRIRKAS